MRFAIIDCYTDEPSGLGVMPYLGTYPRYLFGAVLEQKQEGFYLTIDDVRATVYGHKDLEDEVKTNIKVRNLSKNFSNTGKIVESSDVLIIVAGIHTPGKYLSAYPGTTKEISSLLKNFNVRGKKILTGPAASAGSGLWGGRIARSPEEDFSSFDLVVKDLEYKFGELFDNGFSEDFEVEPKYPLIEKKAILGTKIVSQLPHKPEFLIAEIETMRGCNRKIGCSFCTEPIKCPKVERRNVEDILAEIKHLAKEGIVNFRVGKQTCFYSYGTAGEIGKLLSGAAKFSQVLHIDNVNPAFVNEEKTKLIVKYCTAGNIAAFGVESFDPEVIEKNNLNATPEAVYRAVKLINQYGALRGDNGMPKFLPGINLIFGLIGESRKTPQENIFWLKKILDDDLLLRRINVREAVVFPGTKLALEAGDKFLRKNQKYYWKWRNEIRQKIDFPMLQKLVPVGTILRGLRTEIYDGKTTFARQIGTYPLIVGIKGRIGLDRMIDVRVKSWMLRSVVGEEVIKE